MLPSQRHLFDIPDDVAYFNCAYMGPLMHAVADAGARGTARKMRPWSIKQDDFFTESEHTRSLFARLIGARVDDIAIVPSASYGVETAVRNVDIERGQRIVLLAEQFPSNVYPWQHHAARVGAVLSAVDSPDAVSLSDAVLDAIDERTAVVALPHCRWIDGALLDLDAIGKRCREVGAALVLDVTQSAGAMPFDVHSVQPDFLVSACYKWLLGPYSLGFLYAAPAHHEGEALEQNWITRAGSDDFSGLVAYRSDYQPGARRFDMGERANFHLMPMAIAALEQLHEWTVASIADTLAARTRDIETRLASFELRFTDASARGPHFLAARFEDAVPDGLLSKLASHGVYLSVRGPSLRITPHVYNTDADVDRLCRALDAALA